MANVYIYIQKKRGDWRVFYDLNSIGSSFHPILIRLNQPFQFSPSNFNSTLTITSRDISKVRVMCADIKAKISFISLQIQTAGIHGNVVGGRLDIVSTTYVVLRRNMSEAD